MIARNSAIESRGTIAVAVVLDWVGGVARVQRGQGVAQGRRAGGLLAVVPPVGTATRVRIAHARRLVRGLNALVAGLATIQLGQIAEKKESGEIPVGEPPADASALESEAVAPAEEAPAESDLEEAGATVELK